MFADLPPFAAWRFVGVVDGFEVVYAEPRRLRGHTTSVEDGRPYAVAYEITLDDPLAHPRGARGLRHAGRPTEHGAALRR